MSRNAIYWVTTALLALELVLGGVWDVLRVPQVHVIIDRLGYPPYFLVILGIWKLLGAVAVIVPRFPRLKEWAYAGVVFDLTERSCQTSLPESPTPEHLLIWC